MGGNYATNKVSSDRDFRSFSEIQTVFKFA